MAKKVIGIHYLQKQFSSLMKAVCKLHLPVVQFSQFLLKSNQNIVNCRKFSFTLQNWSNKKPNWGSKKSHRNIKLQLLEVQKMADPKIELVLAPLRMQVKEQVSHGINLRLKNR